MNDDFDPNLQPLHTWVCGCGRVIEHWRGDGDHTCECGAEWNGSGQRLRDDWRGNPSTYDDEIGDLEGFEMQHHNDY